MISFAAAGSHTDSERQAGGHHTHKHIQDKTETHGECALACVVVSWTHRGAQNYLTHIPFIPLLLSSLGPFHTSQQEVGLSLSIR